MTEAKLACGCIVEKGNVLVHCKTNKCESESYIREYKAWFYAKRL